MNGVASVNRNDMQIKRGKTFNGHENEIIIKIKTFLSCYLDFVDQRLSFPLPVEIYLEKLFEDMSLSLNPD